MKIRLVKDIPVEKKHGMVKGLELEICARDHKDGSWVKSPVTNEWIRLWSREFEEVKP